VLTRSPGRVNLIGDHTSYNLGYVLPTAIDRYTKLAAAPRSDRTLRVYSEAYQEQAEIDLDGHIGLLGEETHWANYVRGAVWWLREHDYNSVGADVLIWGDLPIGVGLASSASMIMGIMGTLAQLSGWNVPKDEMARAGHKIESEFIGTINGIVDEVAIAHSEPRSALLIDCRSVGVTTVPFNPAAAGLSMVIVNSGLTREDGNSVIAKRRRECEAALGALKVITYNLELQSLRDITPDTLHSYGGKLYPTLYKRARHVITENERVLQAVVALSVNDFQTAGQLMNESHESLKNDFEVSNLFMDRLVELAQETEGVVGARMFGQGFGGCTVNLVQNTAIRSFDRNVVRRYTEETSLKAETYVVRPAGGLEVDVL
jgi:galactokinase